MRSNKIQQRENHVANYRERKKYFILKDYEKFDARYNHYAYYKDDCKCKYEAYKTIKNITAVEMRDGNANGW